MAVCENSTDFYHTALDSLMDNLYINSTPNLEPSRCSALYKRAAPQQQQQHRQANLLLSSPSEAAEDKYFSFCSTIKRQSTQISAIVSLEAATAKEELLNAGESHGTTTAVAVELNVKETPKRMLSITRKQKLFVAKTVDNIEQQQQEQQQSNECHKKLQDDPEEFKPHFRSLLAAATPLTSTYNYLENGAAASSAASAVALSAQLRPRRELSPQSRILKKAIIRLECMERRQEKMAQNKKPMRTSLRV